MCCLVTDSKSEKSHILNLYLEVEGSIFNLSTRIHKTKTKFSIKILVELIRKKSCRISNYSKLRKTALRIETKTSQLN